MGKIIGLIAAGLFCTVKFAIAFPAAIINFKLNFWESIIFGFVSGSVGNVLFIYAGGFINRMIDKVVLYFRKNKSPKPKKIFTKKNRRFVRIKNSYGLFGLALITPTIISIPVGNFLATRFFHNKGKILLYMCASVLAWTLVISTVKFLINPVH